MGGPVCYSGGPGASASSVDASRAPAAYFLALRFASRFSELPSLRASCCLLFRSAVLFSPSPRHLSIYLLHDDIGLQGNLLSFEDFQSHENVSLPPKG